MRIADFTRKQFRKNSIGICKECGEAIIFGEKYAEIDGYKYHEECLDELTVKEWLDILGERICEAKPDYDYGF